MYVGSNPVSDAFIEKALPLLSRSFRRAVLTGNDLAARTDMMMAASFAGMGFGNAGVHIPHACAYPIAGRVARLPAAGLPAGRADGAARRVGLAHRARRVPVHLPVQPGASPARRGAA